MVSPEFYAYSLPLDRRGHLGNGNFKRKKVKEKRGGRKGKGIVICRNFIPTSPSCFIPRASILNKKKGGKGEKGLFSRMRRPVPLRCLHRGEGSREQKGKGKSCRLLLLTFLEFSRMVAKYLDISKRKKKGGKGKGRRSRRSS